jgi:hypothetical protein
MEILATECRVALLDIDGRQRPALLANGWALARQPIETCSSRCGTDERFGIAWI